MLYIRSCYRILSSGGYSLYIIKKIYKDNNDKHTNNIIERYIMKHIFEGGKDGVWSMLCIDTTRWGIQLSIGFPDNPMTIKWSFEIQILCVYYSYVVWN